MGKAKAVAVVSILVLGLTITGITAGYMLENRKALIKTLFLEEVKPKGVFLETQLAIDLQAPLSTEAFFNSSQVVEREEFMSFTQEMVAEHPSIVAIEWAPKILQAQRAQFVQEARKIDSSFDITVISPTGNLISAPEAAFYLPVYYVYPIETNRDIVGFNLHLTASRQTVEQAIAEGHVAVTNVFTLIQGGIKGFVAYAPVYTKKASLTTPEEREAHLAGIIAVTYSLEKSTFDLLKQLPPGGVNVELFDVTDPGQEHYLIAFYTGPKEHQPQLSHTHRFKVGTREWEARFTPAKGSYSLHPAWKLYAIVGMIFGYVLLTIIIIGKSGKKDDKE